MLPAASTPYARVRPGVLPSRAGDNLFWLGRYVERAEATMRLLRAWHVRLAETADPDAPLAAEFARLSRRSRLDPDEPIPPALLGMLDVGDHQRRQRPRPLLGRWLVGAERPREDRPPHGRARHAPATTPPGR